MAKKDELTERVFVRMSLEDRNTILMLSTSRKGRDRSLSSICREYIREGIEREMKALKKQHTIEIKQDKEQKVISKEKIIENKKESSIMDKIRSALISKQDSKKDWY